MAQYKVFWKAKSGWLVFGTITGSNPTAAFISAGKRGRFKSFRKGTLLGVKSKSKIRVYKL